MENVRYAGAWNRFIAYMVDGVFLNLVLVLLVVLLNMSGVQNGAMLSAIFALYWVASILYFTVMDASASQGTLGKMLIGIKVADAQSGGRISYLRSFARNIVFILISGFILPLFVIFFSTRKRLVQDMAVDSVVMDREAESPGKFRWPRRLVPLAVVLSLLVPSVLGMRFVNQVIRAFAPSAQAAAPSMAFSMQQGNQSGHVAVHSQGNMNFEAHVSVNSGNGGQNTGSWSYSSSGSTAPQTAGDTPELNPTTATAKLIALAKGSNDTDFGAIRLIVKGANVNAKDKQGYTPLYYAVKLHHIDMVKALIFNHARTDLRYPNGMTVWKLAKGDRQMVRALHYTGK
jgi:uncharacterized RDD family membrane protein YckC